MKLQNLELKYRVYSIDIFNTLIFRFVRGIKEVYIQTYNDFPHLFPDYIDGNEWSNIRQEIENKARAANRRRNGSTEINLEDAYNQLPQFWNNREQIRMAEFETEKKLCCVNSEVYDFIKKVKEDKEARVILTSDMYYTSAELKEILTAAGCDISLFDHIYVSCECGGSKKQRKLYEHIIKNEGVSPNEMIHIGDSEYSDYSISSIYGIHAYHYNVISDAERYHPHLKLEKLLYQDPVTELYALRSILAAQNQGKYAKDEQFWYEYGLMVFGPLCTGAAEWVLNQADESGINQIFPLMREGKFLCQLLKQASIRRNNTYTIKPLYVSRKAVFLPSLDQPTRKDIDYVCKSNGIRMKDVFSIFDIEDDCERYREFEELEIMHAKKVVYGKGNLYDEIIAYLTSEKVLDKISNNAQRAKHNILQYFDQMGMKQPYITWDMGWRGYTQNAIDKILKSCELFTRSLNLLIVGKGGSIQNMLEGCNLRGYVSSCGKDWEITKDLYARAYELFYLCEEGTTISYQNIENEVRPILKEIPYKNPKQLLYIKRLQEGVLEFQQQFLELAEKKKELFKIVDKADELCKLVSRSFGAPTYEEAFYMGQLFYDQNFGADNQSKIIEEGALEKMRSKGLQQVFEQENFRNTEWYSGMNCLCDPLYYFKEAYKRNGYYEVYKRIFFAQRIIDLANHKKIILVGAGNGAILLMQFFQIANSNIEVEFIVDNNEKKIGTYRYGIPVVSIQQESESNIYVITSFLYIEELTAQIEKVKGKDVTIIHYRMDNQNMKR